MSTRKRTRGLRGCLDTLFSALVILFPLWVLLCLLAVTMAPTVWRVLEASGALGVRLDAHWINQRGAGPGGIAPLFTREVRHWSADIDRWAAQYAVNPNLLATVIQIESCGDPAAVSAAGAAGLFQVMPFHFAPDDDFFDLETNARRGISVLLECLGQANYDAGRALACYNGGPGTLTTMYTNWYEETQRFYTWGTGIYADALAGSAQSATLDRWLAEGGAALCQRAARTLGFQ